MGKYRKRFNEKARTGMLAKQGALKRARNKQFTRQTEEETPKEDVTAIFNNEDSNTEILKPVTDAEKQERKRRLEETLYSQNEKETKMSKSKKKRLDKYIDHQLKREEKKILFEKLSETKIDTTNYMASKLLGKGKQTRREEMVEALELEKQGRGDERTKEILYEEREVKNWEDEDGSIFTQQRYDDSSDEKSDEESFPATGSKSSFIDNRPEKFGGSGMGFGFANLPKVEKSSSTKKYSWRLKVEREDNKRNKIEDENDFMSTTEEEEDDDEEDEEEEDGEEGSSEEEMDDNEVADDKNGEEKPDQDDVDSESEEESGEGSEDESEEESEEDSDEEDLPRLLQNKAKHSKIAESFKDWAEQQVRALEGRENEAEMPVLSEEIKKQYSKPTVHDEDIDHSSDEEGYIRINKELKREAFFVHVNRSDEIQQLRMNLPVFGEEHKIMEAINHHDCVVICGETGSGKTTQVPQFLYEAGFGNLKSDDYPGMIGVTQPRRVAAVSMAERVGNELGDHGKRVGYQIRFDATVKNEGKEDGTALKFMTDGVLLREMMNDFMLKKYSAVIIDEAHERNINTDILIGMLSRVLKLRRKYHSEDPKLHKPLKLIIMSATLRVSDFSENKQLFKVPPPIIKVDARQYPVSIHFNRRTNYDYLEEAFKKASKIHKKLPPGGILIFLTGQNEITSTVKKLRQEFPFPKKAEKSKKPIYQEIDENVVVRLNKNTDAEAEDVEFSVNMTKEGEEEDDYNSDSDEEEEGFDETLEPHQTEKDPLYVLPLYSLLPTSEQMKVFEKPPAGSRLCIVATNVAETSLTIPGIRYVVDCGRAKERKYNEENGVQSFEIDWVSKASSDQRSGRAGRTGPGHCYRLFSSAIYESYFAQFSKPEILRMPFESVVLTMKSMGIDQVSNFPFPTPPDRLALHKAEKLLTILGALEKEKKTITELGKTMAHFPLSPRFAKILIIGNQQGCLPYVIAIVSALSVGDPFIGENELGIREVKKVVNSDGEEEEEHESKEDEELKRKKRSSYNKSRAMFSRLDSASDALMLLSAVCAFDHVLPEKKSEFVNSNFLRAKVMEEIAKLRRQVDHIVKVNTMPDSIAFSNSDKGIKLGVPDKKQVAAIKQMIASGFIDQVAIRGDLISSDIQIPSKSNVMNIPYAPVFPIHNYDAEMDPYAYIHPNSVLCSTGSMPGSYLIYASLNTGANTKEGQTPKVRMKPLVDIQGKQLANVAKNSPLITYSKPLGNPYAPKLITPTKRECYVVPRFGASIGSGGVGWDLPAIKVIQIKKAGEWIISN